MTAPAEEDTGPGTVTVHLDALLAERGMSLVELARATGISDVNLGVLKNQRAKAIRFSTLAAICNVLGCQPGDLLGYAGDDRPPIYSGASVK